MWGWSKRNAKEVEAWSRLPPFLGCECPACLAAWPVGTAAADVPAAGSILSRHMPHAPHCRQPTLPTTPSHPAPICADFAATLVWQAFMPVSFLAAVAAPLYYAWVLWDDWYVSPVFLATLLTAPMKWVPWADKCLVWPGLI